MRWCRQGRALGPRPNGCGPDCCTRSTSSGTQDPRHRRPAARPPSRDPRRRADHVHPVRGHHPDLPASSPSAGCRSASSTATCSTDSSGSCVAAGSDATVASSTSSTERSASTSATASASSCRAGPFQRRPCVRPTGCSTPPSPAPSAGAGSVTTRSRPTPHLPHRRATPRRHRRTRPPACSRKPSARIGQAGGVHGRRGLDLHPPGTRVPGPDSVMESQP